MGVLSSIYGMALTGRSLLYRTGLIKSKKLPAMVLSIGNLTLGGTGKTPAVIALALEAKKRGFKPCVLTRGYKGKQKGPCLSDGKSSAFLKTAISGDETVLMIQTLGDIPVVKGKNRFLAGTYAMGRLGSDAVNIFILDDGFQHWGLYRDMDILLIDATDAFGNEKLFPEGILREPLDSIKRAGIIVITKSDTATDTIYALTQRIRQYNAGAPVYRAVHRPTAIVNAAGEISSPDTLNRKSVYAVAGIANPDYFRALLTALGADIIKLKTFRDHYNYKQRDLAKIKKEAGGLDIITTEKDLVKLRELQLPDNVYSLRIEFSVENAFYDNIFGGLK
ncbi:MAG: tetraacyldisaccharide 4'-kinase [Nitrospirae bacterium]|nr:tetraacyldisaccharide 4'-kinase [Nitrospirota bacterium]